MCAYYIIISIIAAVLMTNVIFGFLSAVGGPLLPPIIIEFLGEHNLAVGYGILLIFEGAGSFAGPPLAGKSTILKSQPSQRARKFIKVQAKKNCENK